MGLYIDEDGELRDDGVEDGNSSNESEYEQTPTLSDAEVDAYLDSFREEYKDEIPNMDGLEKEVGAANVKTVTDFLSKYGKKALDLFKDDKGNLDWTKLLAMAGGAYAASRPSGSTPTGYQGKIPKLTATSNMLTAPPVGRRPGSGGINYGGGVTYRDETGKIVSSNELTLEELLKAAQDNPFNRPSTYETPIYNRPPVNPTPGGGGLPDIAPTPSVVARPELPTPTGGSGTTTPQFTTGEGSGPDRTGPREPLNSMGLPISPRAGEAGSAEARAAAQANIMRDLEARKAARAEVGDPNYNRFAVTGFGTIGPNGATYYDTTDPTYTGLGVGNGGGGTNNSTASGEDGGTKNTTGSGNSGNVAFTTGQGSSPDGTEPRVRLNSMGLPISGLAKGGLAPKGFVIPADVVSHFGNGSSEAGLKLLVANLGAEPIKGEGDGMSDSIPTTIDGKQEARVANEEAFISPEMVKRIGGGDAEKGAKKLYAMMDRVREERTGTTEQGKQIDPNKFMPGGSVKKYQTGGTTTAKTTPASATGYESSLSNWAGDYVTNMLGQGAALANKPYEAYTGPLTAGASGLQNQAFNMAANLRTPGSIGQAAGTAGGIANLAANMRYTPQTTDFLGGANMSGLGMSPSYGMGMPQQQPVPMPIGQGPTNKLPVNLPPGFQQEPTVFAAGPHRVKGPANFQQDTLEQAFGGSQYDPATGIESRDIRPLTPDDPRYSQRVQTMPQISEEFRPPVSPDRFTMDGEMTGGVMQPPQQAGLPGLMQPQASQQVGNIAQQYINPYLESALRPQMAEMQRAADIARLSDAARLTQAGAYGGSRQAIMESEGRRNLLDKQSEALGQGYATAYDKAMAQFNADQARRAQEAQFSSTFNLEGLKTGLQGAQAQAQAGALQSQSDLANLRGTLEAGGIERGIESEGIAADKAQFEEARLNPYKMVQFQQSLLSQMPLAAQSYSMPSQSNLQQFAGGATTIQQLLDILNGKTAATTKP